jgi:hypothetical protein
MLGWQSTVADAVVHALMLFRTTGLTEGITLHHLTTPSSTGGMP